MAEKESAVEIFKRATASTVRAIAERGDIAVTYGAENAGAAFLTGTGCRCDSGKNGSFVGWRARSKTDCGIGSSSGTELVWPFLEDALALLPAACAMFETFRHASSRAA